jgi:hypothetical protein
MILFSFPALRPSSGNPLSLLGNRVSLKIMPRKVKEKIRIF